MFKGWLRLLGTAAIAMAGASVAIVSVSGQTASQGASAKSGAPARTPWGEPNLQGIWHQELQTPLERPAQYAGKELLTDEEVEAADKRKAAALGRDRRGEGEKDVAGAYNAFWNSVRFTSRRTSLIVDPPDGKIPATTPDAQQRRQASREYLQALLQGTSGGKAGPVSPRRNENPPYYNTNRMNRADGPEDRALAERCLTPFAGYMLPQWDGFNRIVQAPGIVSIYYDVDQGQGYQRVIPVTNAPHLPADLRQWMGDSRGRWDGDTLVVDVTNFSAKSDFLGSHENLHLTERWTRLNLNTLEYSVTISDPSVWTKPWTVQVELSTQDERANRVYYEPRCHEGNYGLAGMLANTRAEEHAFSEGRGPDPATRDIATGGGGE